ncbi:efflux transporter outer membrane subunit [Xylophilus sp. Kf1]|nr:efflux transporter outer membrane subunit [Xylophilus sp. Kf1]
MKAAAFAALAGLTLAALLAGCGTTAVGPDYQAPPALAPEHAASAGDFVSAEPATTSDAPLPARWWRLYRDPMLDTLVRRALEHNTDLRQAVANLEREQAVDEEVRGARYPTATVSGGPAFGHKSGLDLLRPGYQPPATVNYGVSAGLSYRLDLFGQIRRAIEAAEAGTASAQAAVDLVKVNVAAGTAHAYADVCSSGLRLQSASTSLRLQQEAVDLSDRLQQAGRVGAIDAARARGQLEQLRASLPPLQALRQSALFRLSTLTGAPPREFPPEVADCATPPRVAGAIPVGDGAALLRRRPDVRQAERAIAAATARIGVATGDLYPKVSLGISAVSAGKLKDFGGSDTVNYSLGPLISWTIPNTGAARARIRQAEAGTRAALARFDGVVLTALRETETTLTVYARELDRRAALRAARDQSAIVAGQARQLYVNGRTGSLDALDAQRALAGSEAALAASDAQLASDQIDLFMALGGGWEPDAAADTSATTP